jgi:hypothetical protein
MLLEYFNLLFKKRNQNHQTHLAAHVIVTVQLEELENVEIMAVRRENQNIQENTTHIEKGVRRDNENVVNKNIITQILFYRYINTKPVFVFIQ